MFLDKKLISCKTTNLIKAYHFQIHSKAKSVFSFFVHISVLNTRYVIFWFPIYCILYTPIKIWLLGYFSLGTQAWKKIGTGFTGLCFAIFKNRKIVSYVERIFGNELPSHKFLQRISLLLSQGVGYPLIARVKVLFAKANEIHIREKSCLCT